MTKPLGTKHDGGKPRLDLISKTALDELGHVLAFGASKYDAHNWRKGLAWSRLIASAMRHITEYNDGVNTDKESGLSPIAHAMACCMMLLEFERTHKELDDRYKPDVSSDT